MNNIKALPGCFQLGQTLVMHKQLVMFINVYMLCLFVYSTACLSICLLNCLFFASLSACLTLSYILFLPVRMRTVCQLT